MNSIVWQGTNKVWRALFTFAMVAFWTACADESQNIVGPDAYAASRGSVKSTVKVDDYSVTTTVSADGKTWTYTITRKSSTVKNISHFIINLGNCADPNLAASYNDIASAYVNGVPATFVNTEGNTGCYPQGTTTNFVKIVDPGLAVNNQWVIVINYEVGFTVVTTTGWIKAGTSCHIYNDPANLTGTTYGNVQISGPGCRITEYCSFSQGSYFGNGYDNNGSIARWPVDGDGNPVLNVAGNLYAPSETNALWAANTGPGARAEIRAFFQYSAIILSLDELGGSIPDAIAADMNTILAYYTTYNTKLTPSNISSTTIFPTSKDVAAAGGRIGDFINANHCQ